MSRARRALVPALLFAAPVLCHHEVTLQGKAYLLRDLFNWFHPWREFASRSLWHGEVPLWNPYAYAGTPFLANMQSGLLYPLNLPFWLLGSPAGMAPFLVLQSGLTAWMMHRLLRAFGRSRAASAAGGLAYALSGWMAAHVEFPNKLAAAAWLPMMVLGLVVWRRGRPLRGLLLASGAVALSVAAGYPQTAATMVAGAGVFWIAAVAEAAARGPRAALSAVVSLPAAVALGLLLAGAQVLPFGEAAALSERAEPYETTRVLQETLQPGHLLQLASPRIFGLPGYQRYWGGTLWQFWLGSFYAGLITLLCACLAPAAAAGLRESPGGPAGPRWGIAAASLLLVFGLLLSHGDTTPFAGWVVSAVAGFGYFRWFATTSVLFVFALCFLAPFGMDHLLSRARSGGRAALRAGAFVAVPAAAAMALAVTAAAAPGAFVGLVRLAVAPVMHADQQAAFAASAPLARADAFGAAGVLAAGALVLAACASGRLSRRRAGWCLTLILLADLCLAARGLNAAGDPAVYTEPPTSLDRVRRSTAGPARLYVPDETLKHDLAMYGSRDEQMFRWASAAFLYNLNIPWGLFSASDGDPIRPRRMGAWHAAVESEQDLERRRRLLAAANVSVVLYGEPGSDLRGSQVPDALPRALVAAGARREPPEAMLEIIASGAWDPRREVLVEEDFRGVPLPPGPPVRHTVHALDYTANGVTLDVEAASEGYLVLLDMAYPGWRADVDGRPARLFKANFMFRGLELPAGRHIVRFRYRPGALAAGAVASAIGLMIACAAVWADRRPGLSRRSAPTRRNGPSPGTGSAPRRTEPTP